MKNFFQQILLGAKARCPRPAFFDRNKKSGTGQFNPAPSYWALIPVKPQSQKASNGNKAFDE
jgi:hypothetical protein